MTRIDLVKLIKRREICHPSRLKSLTAAGQELRIVFEGYPWWRAHNVDYLDGFITFIFKDTDGFLDLRFVQDCGNDEADEVLEDFSIVRIKAGDWADTPCFSIFGQAPLPDPKGLYERLHAQLQKLQSYKKARDFLNCPPGKLSRFVELTNASAYLLARVPKSLCEFICVDLKAQGVPFNIVGKETHRDGLIVRWQDTTFGCQTAYAEFD